GDAPRFPAARHSFRGAVGEARPKAHVLETGATHRPAPGSVCTRQLLRCGGTGAESAPPGRAVSVVVLEPRPQSQRIVPNQPVIPSGARNLSSIALQIECPGIDEARFASVAALDAADAEEFLAAALQVSFGILHEFRGHDDDHADAHVEG